MIALAITAGDPAGIGPEIALKACADARVRAICRPVVVGSRRLLARVAADLSLAIPEAVDDPELVDFAADAVEPGKVQAECGAAAAAAVVHAARGCLAGRYAAMATAPLNKEALAAAGVPHPGHTELLAEVCGVRGEAMMLYHQDLAVALVTMHQALRSVPDSLDPRRIVAVGALFAAALRRLRGRPPRLAVLGLNPHAGEHGLFGDEERRIVPAVAELQQLGIDVDGPLSPDTAFTPAARRRYDGWLCMYHDQGLIPFKALCFDDGVNVTLGLPIVRTSVDHGTAFDIAWRGVADPGSLIAAIELAARLASQRG